ncbi:MAG: hypothetical protein OK439_06590 [Thaumarchaeota archaeon]|nr:hypothetical protein [Nitrososphaerota archaeon]
MEQVEMSETLSRPEAETSLSTKCQRCAGEISREKAAVISFKKKTMYFCDNCFKSVFKYDENLRTVNQIWEENGRNVPFIIRSSNWHRSSYMKVKEVKSANSSKGKPKLTFVGDMYLRGDLKEQDRNIGKSNHFIWFCWSEEIAQKYKEPPQIA